MERSESAGTQIYLLYWYKSANTDAAACTQDLEVAWTIDNVEWSDFVKPGTHLTCFTSTITSTKVQILTPEELSAGGADGAGSEGRRLKPGDRVDFLVSYDRKEQRLAAVGIRKSLAGDAPPPATLLVLPAGKNPTFTCVASTKVQILTLMRLG